MRLLTSCFIRKLSVKLEPGSRCDLQESTPTTYFYQLDPPLLKVPRPPKTVPPAGEQDLKLTLKGMFPIQTLTASEPVGGCGTCPQILTSAHPGPHTHLPPSACSSCSSTRLLGEEAGRTPYHPSGTLQPLPNRHLNPVTEMAPRLLVGLDNPESGISVPRIPD